MIDALRETGNNVESAVGRLLDGNSSNNKQASETSSSTVPVVHNNAEIRPSGHGAEVKQPVKQPARKPLFSIFNKVPNQKTANHPVAKPTVKNTSSDYSFKFDKYVKHFKPSPLPELAEKRSIDQALVEKAIEYVKEAIALDPDGMVYGMTQFNLSETKIKNCVRSALDYFSEEFVDEVLSDCFDVFVMTPEAVNSMIREPARQPGVYLKVRLAQPTATTERISGKVKTYWDELAAITKSPAGTSKAGIIRNTFTKMSQAIS
jgi:hypothetical protein